MIVTSGRAARPPGQTVDDRLNDLHSRCAKPLTSYIVKLTLGDVRMAEDIVQETFLRAWRFLSTAWRADSDRLGDPSVSAGGRPR